VESIDELPESLFKDPAMPDQGWGELLHVRQELGLGLPTHSIWLDCIDANYFLELDWIDQRLDDQNPRERQERRRNILALESENFVVVQLLLCYEEKREGSQLTLMGRSQWHQIQISDRGPQPALVAADYSALEEGGVIRYLKHISVADKKALRRLYNVFNVDFIEEMEEEDNDSPGTTGGGQPVGPDSDDSGVVVNAEYDWEGSRGRGEEIAGLAE
jgi:hypothetical protein